MVYKRHSSQINQDPQNLQTRMAFIFGMEMLLFVLTAILSAGVQMVAASGYFGYNYPAFSSYPYPYPYSSSYAAGVPFSSGYPYYNSGFGFGPGYSGYGPYW